MTAPSSRWTPSRTEQAIQWWLRLLLRYLIGGGGLVYEILIDKLRNPTALVVFAGLAGLPDVLGYRAMIRAEQSEPKSYPEFQPPEEAP